MYGNVNIPLVFADIPIPAGSRFVGLLNVDHDFCSARKATERDLIIESVERSNIFPVNIYL